MTNEFRSAYAYAQRNGYTGTYKQYVAVQYDAYCAICKRQEITPLSYAEWVKG